MELIFRRPILSDRNKIDKFLILLKDDYVPPFSALERKEELDRIYAKKAKAILAMMQKQIAGYIVWEQYSKNKKDGYVANLGVHPEYRRRGISTRLRKIAFGQIRKAGFKGVYYTTWHKNIGMVDSSKKLGMKIIRTYLDEKFRGPGGRTILYRKDF
jgi:ribosomal protein S18 acetylase RimI-like enzyme